MAALQLVLLLLAVSAGLRLVAERLTVPYAAVLVVGGLLLALIPGLPRVSLPPDVLFLIFIPPLLYSGAISFPLRDFRREIGAILRLSVVMVLVSTAAVALVAHRLYPSFTWAAAITLGAIVSPPDPVAVLSIMRTMRAPRAIVTILEGEGLVNDATALVIYRLAVTAALTGVRAVAGIKRRHNSLPPAISSARESTCPFRSLGTSVPGVSVIHKPKKEGSAWRRFPSITNRFYFTLLTNMGAQRQRRWVGNDPFPSDHAQRADLPHAPPAISLELLAPLGDLSGGQKAPFP